MPNIKRTYQDSVFKNMFEKEDKKYLLELYQALHPEDTDTKASDLIIVSLENILIDSIYNDLGFVAGDSFIILVEAQSTWCVNLIVRLFLYLAQTYHDYLYGNDIRKRKILSTTKYKNLPKPEVYILYTGEEKSTVKSEISFREEFFPNEDVCLDLTAKVITIKDDRKDIIGQYISFCKTVKDQIRKHKELNKTDALGLGDKEILMLAIKASINICINSDILSDYLNKNKMEVADMLFNTITQDEAIEI